MKRPVLFLAALAIAMDAGAFFRPDEESLPPMSVGPAEAPPKVFDCQIIVRSNVQKSWEVTVEMYGDERCEKSRLAVAREALRQVRCARMGYCPPPESPLWPDTIRKP